MSQTRYYQEYDRNGTLLSSVPYQVSDEEIEKESRTTDENIYLEAVKSINAKNPERADIKNIITNAISDLDAIIGMTGPTNAQVIAAVKTVAQIERAILRYHLKEIQM